MAISEDIPKIVEMGRRFRQTSSYHRYLPENAEKMTELAENLLNASGLLVSELDGKLIGMFGFIIHSHFMSGEIVAGEVFWWVEPECRGEGLKLLKFAEKFAKSSGATSMQMIAPTDQVGNVYKRLGYEFVESTYQRQL